MQKRDLGTFVIDTSNKTDMKNLFGLIRDIFNNKVDQFYKAKLKNIKGTSKYVKEKLSALENDPFYGGIYYG